MTGHVFVTRGDITRLNINAWLLPTDREVRVESQWGSDVFDPTGIDTSDASFNALRSEEAFAVTVGGAAGPVPVLTAVPFEGASSFSELRPRLLAGLRLAASIAQSTASGRRPIIATPAFGVGGGGADANRGEVIAGILECAGEVAEDAEVDVVVCLYRAVDHALAQQIRLKLWEQKAPLGQGKMAAVESLRAKVAAGRLVPFMGSGVSASAGLPTWNNLLLKLAEGAGREREIDPEGWFKELSALDKAHVVRGGRDKRTFGEAVKELTSARRYGLAPALLASLPTGEAVTLNYDQLYEMASDDQGQPTAVLPFEPLADSERWLLKMHGCVSRPESIVLTRGDYIDFRSEGANAASLAKALLMTKHLLFVGFGLSDDHFHDLVHEVHRSFSGAGPIGTALVLGEAEGHKEVWGGRIEFVTFTGGGFDDMARDLEIFLDVLSAVCAPRGGHLMDPRYDSQLDDAERKARDAFQRFIDSEWGVIASTSIGRDIAALFVRRGGLPPSER